MTWKVIDFVFFVSTRADKKEKKEKHEPNKFKHNTWPDILKVFVECKF